jgi:hypothetical protein
MQHQVALRLKRQYDNPVAVLWQFAEVRLYNNKPQGGSISYFTV